MKRAEILATRLEVERSLRDGSDVGDCVALRLLERMPAEPPPPDDEVLEDPLPDVCLCGALLRPGDWVHCRGCAS